MPPIGLLLIVLLLMGSVLYEVTRTEPAARQHAPQCFSVIAHVKPVAHLLFEPE